VEVSFEETVAINGSAAFQKVVAVRFQNIIKSVLKNGNVRNRRVNISGHACA
jgi:hypothetical protein